MVRAWTNTTTWVVLLFSGALSGWCAERAAAAVHPVFLPNTARAQQSTPPETQVEEPWQIQQHPSQASFRGLHMVDDQVIWVSGSDGTVIRSTDGGKTWQSVGPGGDAKQLDFRDVHAFGTDQALLLTAGSPARVYRTSDGGKSWSIAFEESRSAAFFDAMAFSNESLGYAFSDPIDGKLLVIQTRDGGRSWKILDEESLPETLEGEAGFAASGSCLCLIEEAIFIGLGGKRPEGMSTQSRILMSRDEGRSWTATEVPIKSGQASGVFSIAFANRDHGVAVGGTYTQADDDSSNICITDDGGQHWRKPTGTPPGGYRSCVAVRPSAQGTALIAVGRNGSDISDDWGNSWRPLGREPFHCVAFSSDGKTGIAVGRDGKIGLWK